MSPRARDALASADLIAAEDTRHTGALLQAIGVSRPLVSLHEHNEAGRVPELLARLEAGEIIALVSDAGTPLLSDPGFELVREAAARGIAVQRHPRASAITAALAVAGLPTDRFCFEGFLPARDGERRTQLAALADESRTLVFFEAPHRIAQTLADMASAFGAERPAVVARELTKLHETVYRGTLAELVDQAGKDANFARGEITLVVQGAPVSASAVDARTARAHGGLARERIAAGKAAVARRAADRRDAQRGLCARDPQANNMI